MKLNRKNLNSSRKPRPKRLRRVSPPSSRPFDWKSPDENTKLKWALSLVALCLIVVAFWSGEIAHHQGTWKIGLRDLRGQLVLGLVWNQGEWPKLWP